MKPRQRDLLNGRARKNSRLHGSARTVSVNSRLRGEPSGGHLATIEFVVAAGDHGPSLCVHATHGQLLLRELAGRESGSGAVPVKPHPGDSNCCSRYGGFTDATKRAQTRMERGKPYTAGRVNIKSESQKSNWDKSDLAVDGPLRRW